MCYHAEDRWPIPWTSRWWLHSWNIKYHDNPMIPHFKKKKKVISASLHFAFYLSPLIKSDRRNLKCEVQVWFVLYSVGVTCKNLACQCKLVLMNHLKTILLKWISLNFNLKKINGILAWSECSFVFQCLNTSAGQLGQHWTISWRWSREASAKVFLQLISCLLPSSLLETYFMFDCRVVVGRCNSCSEFMGTGFLNIKGRLKNISEGKETGSLKSRKVW